MPWSGGLVSNGKGGAAGGNITVSAVRKQREMIQLASSSLASPETQAPERWPHSKCVSPVKSNLSRSTPVDTSRGVSMVVSSQD